MEICNLKFQNADNSPAEPLTPSLFCVIQQNLDYSKCNFPSIRDQNDGTKKQMNQQEFGADLGLWGRLKKKKGHG